MSVHNGKTRARRRGEKLVEINKPICSLLTHIPPCNAVDTFTYCVVLWWQLFFSASGVVFFWMSDSVSQTLITSFECKSKLCKPTSAMRRSVTRRGRKKTTMSSFSLSHSSRATCPHFWGATPGRVQIFRASDQLFCHGWIICFVGTTNRRPSQKKQRKKTKKTRDHWLILL